MYLNTYCTTFTLGSPCSFDKAQKIFSKVYHKADHSGVCYICVHLYKCFNFFFVPDQKNQKTQSSNCKKQNRAKHILTKPRCSTHEQTEDFIKWPLSKDRPVKFNPIQGNMTVLYAVQVYSALLSS